MTDNRLNIVAVENRQNRETVKPSLSSLRNKRKEETQAKFEQMWQQNPSQFHSLRNCREQERVKRTLQLIKEHLELSHKLIADLGCGDGSFSKALCEQGARVDAVDVAESSLNCVRELKLDCVETYQECLPKTLLKDEAYDLVVSTDVIAYLPADDYRLYFSELSRLLKADGSVVCSTSVDFNSEDALQRFANLSETEFKIEKWIFSHHAWHIRLCQFFEIPEHFVRASEDCDYFQKVFEKKNRWGKCWLRINSSRVGALFWRSLAFLLQPLLSLLKHNRRLLLQIEKLCKFFSDSNGISHAIFIGGRRPLAEAPMPGMEPIEVKRKKTVWE